MTEKKRKELHELLESDMTIRREFLGLQTQLAPFPQHCSCQRIMMVSSHLAQALVLQGAEPPRIFTGMENVIGKYEFSTTRRDQDMRILDIVPKFRPSTWKHGDDMPSMTVICRGLKDGLVHYFDVERYTRLHDGFGYINDRPDIDLISAENDLPKDAVITRSPAWKGNDYCMGVNANVVFMTHWAVTEDAVVISESLAKKCTNLDIRQEKLALGVDDILLNIYGDKDMDEYKVIPDIGETVGPDGILAAIRTKNSTSYVSDMTPEALMTTEPLHDELIKAPPGSKILDVDVYINFALLGKIDENDSAYSQLLRIFRDHQYYYDTIIMKYRQYKEWGFEIDEAFNTLVLRAMEMTANPKLRKKNIKLCETREPIEFINVVITYAHEREITVGSKITGREGYVILASSGSDSGLKRSRIAGKRRSPPRRTNYVLVN